MMLNTYEQVLKIKLDFTEYLNMSSQEQTSFFHKVNTMWGKKFMDPDLKSPQQNIHII